MTSPNELKRPRELEFALEFCGAPEEAIARQYIEALEARAALAQPGADIEPAAYLHRQGNYTEASEMSLSEDEKARGWTEEPLFHHPLAQPEPEGPMPEVDDILRLAAIIRRVDGNHDKGAAALAEAILAHPGSRWSPAIQPVPVAERLPEPKDCASEGTKHVGCCWQWLPDDGLGHWALAHRDWADAGDATHLLPYHALPIPQPTQPHET